MKNLTIAFILLALAGCQTSDQEIRTDIAGKAQQDLNFSGLQYTVTNGVVHFTGRCPSDQALAKVQQTIKNIHVIKAATYDVLIAPVSMDNLTPVKLQKDSILAQYPQVIAIIENGNITFRGSVKAVQRNKLVQELQKRRHGRILDCLTIN